ncbi:MAG: sugar phosphate isomerase/epimerase [Chitinivibrionales bacterium]|nr:sugar phosphate isomerase/epimerase [Chitinivibrionales bacterium]
MNKIGIYYAYWTHDWDADFIPYVKKVAKLGFDILEVNSGTVVNMGKSARQKLKDAACKEGIELTYCIGLSAEYDIASDNKTIRKNGINYLKKSAEMLKDMQGKKLSGIIYSSWPGNFDPKKISKEKAWENSVKSMREVAPLLEDYDVFFNVEVVNRFEQYLLNTCDEALAYVNQVGSPQVKVLLDTYHMNIEEDHIGAAIIAAGKHLGHLHIGENNRRPPGYGHIPWKEVGSALKKIKYNQAIVMEPFLMPGGEVGRDIRVFRDLRYGADLDKEAKKALNFIRKIVN